MRSKASYFLKSQTALLVCSFVVAGAFVIGQWGTTLAIDSPAPKIIGANVQTLSATSAIITWTTDKDSDGSINYGTNPNYGVARDTEFATKVHTISIKDLEPLTTYFFRIISSDSQANQGISEGYTFTTLSTVKLGIAIKNPQQKKLAERIVSDLRQVYDPDVLYVIADEVKELANEILKPPAIIGEPRLEIEADSVTVFWATDKEADSMVSLVEDAQYDPESEDPYTIRQGNPDEYTLSHEVRVVGLRSATKYRYEVGSKPEVGPGGRSATHSFMTKSISPTINNIRLDKIQEDSATISFRTNIPASANIEYMNLATREKKSAGDPVFSTAHTIQMINLKFANDYSAIIHVQNDVGDVEQSQPIRFRTIKDEAPPIITKVNNESTLYPSEDTKVQTIVSWKTDEVAHCQFFYQASIADGAKPDTLPREVDPVTDHVQVITIFQPATVYKFWVECDDRTGNHARSDDFVMFTPQREKSIIDIIIENFQGSFGWLKKIGK